MSDRLDDLLLRYKMAHNIAFNEIDPHSPKHKGNGMSKVFKRSKEIEAESLQEIQSYIDTRENKARIDELKGFKDDDNGSYYLESIRNGGNVQDRIKVLQAELRKTL